MSGASSSMLLEVISGNAAGSTIVVEDELLIGRHVEGAGRLSEDEEISRRHARVSREVTGDYAIEDLGSSNGTFVNGLRIQSPRLLALGDSIETGGTTLLVSEILQPQAAAANSNRAPEGEAVADVRSSPTVAGHIALATPTPPLAIKLEVDFDAREARIALGDGEGVVRVVLEDEGWRVSAATGETDR